jgi:putative toxin-antitoxin system antitoxin component (TIGR02293 family)
MELSNVQQVLGLKAKIRSQIDLVELGEKGLSKVAASRLAKHLAIGLKGIAPLLSINERTIQRYSAQKVFGRAVSERIIRIALVVAKGEEVFGEDPFRVWLKETNKALGGKTPLSLLASDFGIDMVLDELNRIEHGIIS